jgi:hypothetical protein
MTLSIGSTPLSPGQLSTLGMQLLDRACCGVSAL